MRPPLGAAAGLAAGAGAAGAGAAGGSRCRSRLGRCAGSAAAAAFGAAAGAARGLGTSVSPSSSRIGDDGIDLHALGAFGHDDLADLALVDRLDLHGRLVGLDLADHLAGLDGVADLDVPLGELALGHGGRQRGHQDIDRHGLAPASAIADFAGGLDDVVRPAAAPSSRGSPRRAAARRGPCTRLTGASSQSKAWSIICAASSEPMPANGQPSSTETSRLVFLTELTMRLGVERAQAAQVDHLGLDALLGELLGRLQRLADHDREGGDGDVLALRARSWPCRSAARSRDRPARRTDWP